MVDDFDHYYAVAGPHGKVTAGQFERFMGRIGAPLAAAPASVSELFQSALIERVWTAREFAFDAVKLQEL